ncbi:MAG: hypothetical protein QXT26_06040 [Thermoproteota archaeon]
MNMFDNFILKERLFEFVRFNPDPFDVDFLERHANVLIDRARLFDVLFELECEGKIVCLSDGRYVSAYAAIKRWIEERFVFLELPSDLVFEVERFLRDFCVRESVEQFIVNAIKNLVQEMRKCRS